MTVEVELGERTLAALRALTAALSMRQGGEGGAVQGEKIVDAGGWLKMSEACRAWSISPPTVRKRVEDGLIEVRHFGEKNPRYRLRQEAM